MKSLSRKILFYLHQIISDSFHSTCVRTAYRWPFKRTLIHVHTTREKNLISKFRLWGTLIITQHDNIGTVGTQNTTWEGSLYACVSQMIFNEI